MVHEGADQKKEKSKEKRKQARPRAKKKNKVPARETAGQDQMIFRLGGAFRRENGEKTQRRRGPQPNRA